MNWNLRSILLIAGTCCVIGAAAGNPEPASFAEQTWIWPPKGFEVDVSADGEEFKIDLKTSPDSILLPAPDPEGKAASKAGSAPPVPSLSLVAKAASPQEVRLTLVAGEADGESGVRPVKLGGKTVGILELPEPRVMRFHIPRAVLKPLGDRFEVMIDHSLAEVNDANSDKINVPPDSNWLGHTIMRTLDGRLATYSAWEPVILGAKLHERKPKTYNEALEAFGPAFVHPLSGIGFWEWHFDDGQVYRAMWPDTTEGFLQKEIKLQIDEDPRPATKPDSPSALEPGPPPPR